MTQVYFAFTDKSTLNLPSGELFVYSGSMTIGKRIKKLRIDAGMTMDALAALFVSEDKPDGLTKQAISAWEKDRNQLTADQIIRMCEIFNVSTGYLLLGKDDKEEELILAYRQLASDGEDSQEWVLGMANMLVHQKRRRAEHQDAPVKIQKPKQRGNA